MRGEHAAAHRLERAVGISVAEGNPAHEKCVRKHPRIADGFGGIDQAVGGFHRLVSRTGDHKAATRFALANVLVSPLRVSWARHSSTYRSGWPTNRYALPRKASTAYGTLSLAAAITVWPTSL